MQVLLVNFERGWRGGERQTLLTAIELKAQGWQPTVLVRKKGMLAQRLKDHNIDIIEKNTALSALVYLFLNSGQYDIFHAQTSAAFTWLASLKWRLKGKLVFTRRTAFPLNGDSSPIETCSSKRIQRLRWKWHQADAFVAISEAAALDPRTLGVQPYIIPSAVEFVPADTDHIIDFTEKNNLSGRYVIGTSAALSHEKDPCTSIRAIHALWQKRQDFVFLHFGADGNAKEEAISLVNELGLQDVYRFMGFEPRIEDMYRLMHVFVLSSKYEALGSSVLDAFMYVAPVVATNAGGLVELLADGRGIECKVGDFEAIADGCDKILENTTFREQMIVSALKWVQEHHSVEKMVQSYMQLYAGELSKPEIEPESEPEIEFKIAAETE